MYLSAVTISGFRQFSSEEPPFTVTFQQGLTALVGPNDSGKSAIVDAIRLALGTRDQAYLRVLPEDFHIGEDGEVSREVSITCRFDSLSVAEQGAFAEYLSHEDGVVFLLLKWTARRTDPGKGGRRWVDIRQFTGVDGSGPAMDSGARDLLAATYLRPLRDASRELSPGRGSRLSQILSHFPGITDGEPFDESAPPSTVEDLKKLSLSGLGDYLGFGVTAHGAIRLADSQISDDYLDELTLASEQLTSRIAFATGSSDDAKLRQVLERLELGLRDGGKRTRGEFGLGSSNLLFIACELLLLQKESEGLRLLLVEEPEAHLHPQRQLRLSDYLYNAARNSETPIQVLVTTHSPNFASRVPLDSLVLLADQVAFPLTRGGTALSDDDYLFLERFLDVTKANLFFAHGVIVVEGIAEAILLPTLARLLGRDFTKHGVSVVNAGGTGLGRYSRILRPAEADAPGPPVRVASLTDLDVIPSAAIDVLEIDPESPSRRWKTEADFDETTLPAYKKKKANGSIGNHLELVSDYWTLEYDLAASGLAREVHLAGVFARRRIGTDGAEVQKAADEEFANLQSAAENDPHRLASLVYRPFYNGSVSKGVAAQYLARILELRYGANGIDEQHLPIYLSEAIRFVTSASGKEVPG